MGSVGGGRGADWLPQRRPVADRSGMVRWEPPGVRERLAPDGDWDAVRYVVVDELHDGAAGLVVTPWPWVDGQGRLVFGEEDEAFGVTVSADELLAMLRARRQPIVEMEVDDAALAELRERELAIGDVLGVRGHWARGRPGERESAGTPPERLDEWFEERVLDVTAVAREAAKLQASAAVVGAFDERLMDTIGHEMAEDEDRPGA